MLVLQYNRLTENKKLNKREARKKAFCKWNSFLIYKRSELVFSAWARNGKLIAEWTTNTVHIEMKRKGNGNINGADETPMKWSTQQYFLARSIVFAHLYSFFFFFHKMIAFFFWDHRRRRCCWFRAPPFYLHIDFVPFSDSFSAVCVRVVSVPFLTITYLFFHLWKIKSRIINWKSVRAFFFSLSVLWCSECTIGTFTSCIIPFS